MDRWAYEKLRELVRDAMANFRQFALAAAHYGEEHDETRNAGALVNRSRAAIAAHSQAFGAQIAAYEAQLPRDE